jgi:hypothetical protein
MRLPSLPEEPKVDRQSWKSLDLALSCAADSTPSNDDALPESGIKQQQHHCGGDVVEEPCYLSILIASRSAGVSLIPIAPQHFKTKISYSLSIECRPPPLPVVHYCHTEVTPASHLPSFRLSWLAPLITRAYAIRLWRLGRTKKQ